MAAKDWTNLFNKYKGKWVALKDDEVTVIASGNAAKEVLNKAIKNGYQKPILFRVPSKKVAYIGLV